MGNPKDIMTVAQLENLLQAIVDNDPVLEFDRLHPAAFQHLFDAIRQGIKWGNEVKKLKRFESSIKPAGYSSVL